MWQTHHQVDERWILSLVDKEIFVSLHLKLTSVAKREFCPLYMVDYSSQADKFCSLLKMMGE